MACGYGYTLTRRARRRRQRPWYEAAAYRGMAFVADYNRRRYAITTVPLEDIATATVEQLLVLREATEEEVFVQYRAPSSWARGYTSMAQTYANDLAPDQPRFDWTYGKCQLLTEDQDMNLMRHATSFDAEAYVKLAATVTAVSNGNPTGSIFSHRITMAAGDSTFPIYGTNVDIEAGASYVASFYARHVNAPWIWVRGDGSNDGGLSLWAAFDIQNRAVGDALSSVAWSRVEDGELFGFSRFSLSWDATLSLPGSGNLVFRVGDGPTPSPSATAQTGTEAFELWGVGLSPYGILTTFIPTGNSAVTRAPETFRLSPVCEALLRRSAGGVVVRGRLHSAIGFQKMIGRDGDALIGLADSPTELVSQAGFIPMSAFLGFGTITEEFGAVLAWDGAGRTLIANGSGTSDEEPVPPGEAYYLGRCDVIGAGDYANGRWNFLGIMAFDERPPYPQLQPYGMP